MTSLITSGQAAQYRQIVEGAARKAVETAMKRVASVTSEDFQNVLEHGDDVAHAMITACVRATQELTVANAALLDWVKFYREMFGIELDVSTLRFTIKWSAFDRLIVVAGGLSIQQVYDKCRGLFPCWKYTDQSLDEIVTVNDRDPKNGTYAVWVRDRVEADEEHKNKSANDLAKAKIKGETLLERLLHELKYWKETGKHLDIQNVTLCSGSRNSLGDVPSVSWYGIDSKLRVDWYGVDFRDGHLRTREVV
jgi:hypothetical protein